MPAFVDANILVHAEDERARRQERSDGDLLSELARETLPHRSREDSGVKEAKSFYGLDPLPPRGEAVSNELIDKLREEDSEDRSCRRLREPSQSISSLSEKRA